MSRLWRKPRPLDRDQQDYRDDRLYIVACDDTYAPKQYFEAYKIPRLQIHVIPTEDGTSSAKHVLKRLLEYESEERDERWMLLDTDRYAQREHLKSFKRALKEARKKGVHVALSKPCFEFWLLLHHLARHDPDLQQVSTARHAENLLRKALGSYKKNNLKPEDFSLQRVVQAIVEGQAVDTSVGGGDIPRANASRVYRLWESIIRNASPAQLPEELRNLKRKLDKL